MPWDDRELGPQSTIAELRAKLEQQRSLALMHDIKLIHGLQELMDGARIKIEEVLLSASVARTARSNRRSTARSEDAVTTEFCRCGLRA